MFIPKRQTKATGVRQDNGTAGFYRTSKTNKSAKRLASKRVRRTKYEDYKDNK